MSELHSWLFKRHENCLLIIKINAKSKFNSDNKNIKKSSANTMQSLFVNFSQKAPTVVFEDIHTDVEDGSPDYGSSKLALKRSRSIYRDDNDIPISPKNMLESPSKKKSRVAQPHNDFSSLFSKLSGATKPTESSNSVAGKTNDSSNRDDDADSSVGSVSLFASSERPRLISHSSEEFVPEEE